MWNNMQILGPSDVWLWVTSDIAWDYGLFSSFNTHFLWTLKSWLHCHHNKLQFINSIFKYKLSFSLIIMITVERYVRIWSFKVKITQLYNCACVKYRSIEIHSSQNYLRIVWIKLIMIEFYLWLMLCSSQQAQNWLIIIHYHTH